MDAITVLFRHLFMVGVSVDGWGGWTDVRDPALGGRMAGVLCPTSPPYFQALTERPRKNLGPFGSNKRPKHSAAHSLERTRLPAPTTPSRMTCPPTPPPPPQHHPPISPPPRASPPPSLYHHPSHQRSP